MAPSSKKLHLGPCVDVDCISDINTDDNDNDVLFDSQECKVPGRYTCIWCLSYRVVSFGLASSHMIFSFKCNVIIYRMS